MTTGQSAEQLPSLPETASEAPASSPPPDLVAFLASLLELQVSLSGAVGGVVYLFGAGSRKVGVVAQHDPEAKFLNDAVMARLERMGYEACIAGDAGPGRVESLEMAKTGAMYGEATSRSVLASVLRVDGRTEGASLLVMPDRWSGNAQGLLRTLALTSANFEAFLWRAQCLAEAEQKIQLREAIELLDAGQQGQSAAAMAAILCHELKRRFACARVSIGLEWRGAIRLEAVSGADEIDRRSPAIRTIEGAMEECATQDIEVLYPPPEALEHDPGERRVTRAHGELSRRYGPAAILSLPLRVEGDLVGVALLERAADDPFPAGAIPLLRLVAETAGPALWTRRLADRGIIAVTRDRLLDLGDGIVGPRHTAAKLIALGVLNVLVLAAAVPIPSRVPASVEIRADVTRTVVPPFRGYLESVRVKPGDRVNAGDVLGVMRTDDLRLQLAEAMHRRDAAEAERDQAMSRGENAKVRMLNAQTQGYDAAIGLLQDRIERATLRSPINGVVSRGDLDQFVGASVESTQALFEVVGDGRIARLQVDERDVRRLRTGQEGWISLNATPGERLAVRVDRVTPAAEAVQGRNVYIADAIITDADKAETLSPGATGVARLRDGLTTTLAWLMRPLVDEIRLRWWL
jgi:multidrug resistance efflux pump